MTSQHAPLTVACIGMGWWSEVLADAIRRSGKLRIAACYSRSESKRNAFAAKYDCRAAPSYEAILSDNSIAAVVNTTPNNAHLETTRAAAWNARRRLRGRPPSFWQNETEGRVKATAAWCNSLFRRKNSLFS